MKVVFALAALAVSTVNASAFELTCSSADQRVVYTEFVSTGGAHMSSASIKLDGTDVYARINYEVKTQDVDFVLGPKIDVAGPFVASNGTKTSTYAKKITLTSKATAEELYAGYILCNEVVAPPCLMCP